MSVRILLGDCRDVLKTLPEASVDSIVTDPPYELGFMGKGWDSTGIANDPAMWAECLRVLKPGGHLLAFSGTRTYHRMVCAIEDAGFEIRDQIGWVYASGFPKSLDVSKAIDKAAGAEREVIAAGKPVKRMIPGADQNATGSWIKDNGREFVPTVTEPATEAARQWQGWGTALKPAWEPICVARKPLIGNVAANVLTHGTGAINVDACRIMQEGQEPATPQSARWPANLIHDGSEEVLQAFPREAGAASPVKGTEASPASVGNVTGKRDRVLGVFHGDNGSAARFFYCAKADAADRGEGNTHPTVKPGDLMRYLCRLVTPPGGTVLDPFAGSGSTLLAADREGFNAIGIELNPAYADMARRRIHGDAPLFAEVA